MKREMKQEDRGAPPAQSKASHTPGPWHVTTPASNNYRFEVHGETGPRGAVRVIALVPAPNGRANDAEHNAKLIAAAPELAFQLTKLLAFIEGMREGGTPVIPEIDDSAKAALRAAGLIAEDAPEAPEKIP